MKKNIRIRFGVICLILVLLTTTLGACGNSSEDTAAEFDPSADFESIIDQAKGTTVTFYGWGGDEDRNKWLTDTIAPTLKDKYDLTLEVVGMDIEDILTKLSGEKQAGANDGTIDIMWINGENFYSAKENGMLFGPFLEYLPSSEYLDTEDTENEYDFGYAVEGYEAPYGKAQLVFINDSARTPETPANTDELMDFVKKYPGKVTYPAMPDFTASAFVRNIIYDICGYEQFQDMEADKAKVKEAIQPAIDYLKALNPHLWNEGKTFPAEIGEVEKMFADEELDLYMDYGSYTAATKIADGTFSDTARTFLFEKGNIGNTNYMAIANNASNKAGAMVAINYIMSPEGQLSQYQKLLTVPVLDNSKLSADYQEIFEAVDIGKGTLTQEELLEKRLPEMPADLVPIIEEIWEEEVVGN